MSKTFLVLSTRVSYKLDGNDALVPRKLILRGWNIGPGPISFNCSTTFLAKAVLPELGGPSNTVRAGCSSLNI